MHSDCCILQARDGNFVFNRSGNGGDSNELGDSVDNCGEVDCIGDVGTVIGDGIGGRIDVNDEI